MTDCVSFFPSISVTESRLFGNWSVIKIYFSPSLTIHDPLSLSLSLCAPAITNSPVPPCTQIRKGILQKVSSGPAIPIVNTLVGGVLDTVVFKAVKQATGGKLKYAINGGESPFPFFCSPVCGIFLAGMREALTMLLMTCLAS